MKRSMTLVLNRDSEVGFWGRAFPLSENSIGKLGCVGMLRLQMYS